MVKLEKQHVVGHDEEVVSTAEAAQIAETNTTIVAEAPKVASVKQDQGLEEERVFFNQVCTLMQYA